MAIEPQTTEQLETLSSEFKNFLEIAKYILPLPGEIPNLTGIQVYGGIIPFNGICGGDHLIYVDFKKRFDLDARIRQATERGRPDIVGNLERLRRMAGILLLDVSGHHATDALLGAMLHQAFLLGAIYELDVYGTITKRLFENLNTRFYNSSSLNKFVTMIYGEISEDCSFRFLSAAHPLPLVFSSRHDRFMEVGEDYCTSFPPIGTLPSDNVIDRNRSRSVLGFKEQYEINEWNLMGAGDILLLHTDGLTEHNRNGESYFPKYLQQKVREVKHLNAREIFDAIRSHFLEFAEPADDASIVVIKRT
jgi:serine phosphatase RsbU (regulator of sigma subunit)